MERYTLCVNPEVGNRYPAVGLNQSSIRLNRQVQHACLVRVIKSAGYLISDIGGDLHIEPAVAIEKGAKRLRAVLVLDDAEVYTVLLSRTAGRQNVHVP